MIDQLIVTEEATLLDALRAIDAGSSGLCCVVDERSKLVGVLTDGDIRRSLIAGADLHDRVLPLVQRNPKVVKAGTSRALILDMMESTRITAVPEISEQGEVVCVHTLSSMVGNKRLPNTAVIMAGGKGSRLGALTEDVPKPLLPVAGRPIIEWIVLQLVGGGIQDIYISVNHLAEKIVKHLGDGENLGCHIRYIRENPQTPLGTAGSLTLLPKHQLLSDSPPIIVVNGDVMMQFDAGELVEAHATQGADITVGTAIYEHVVPFGVVTTNSDGKLIDIREKPTISLEVNSALYCINGEVINLLSRNERSDMPDLIQMCLASGREVRTWDVARDWIDIGTPTDFARARGEMV